ncbi:probable tRNA (uracil-O(2)-)-methyltransferase isoform X2 [Cimex lectularius]|nr:probable tRNA (uracil-O(2)-)-methyltransferase isoform X2 [Cimex lectularius]
MDIWISKPFFYLRNCGGVEFIFLNFEPYFCSDFIRKLQAEKENITSYNDLRDRIKCIEAQLITREASVANLATNISTQRYLMVRIAYLKNGLYCPDLVETINCNFLKNQVIFTKALKKYQSYKELHCYEVGLNRNTIEFYVPDFYADCEEMKRLCKIMCTKVRLWKSQDISNHQQITTHKLVQPEPYIELYNRLKKKYAEPVMKMWTESTDPKKAIHQAISIATYLILIWGEKRQTFIDLGCGTGLLVHILNSENHKGKGLDVRSRKIWALYPPTTVLEESTISPTDVYPGVDWLIGNHSDELTPLIPPMAAKSSFRTNFFLLPCCTYDFNGKKYQRFDVEQSQYRSYLDYIEKVCEKCGFVVARDRMKIPSTKRICFVSQGRNYKEEEHEENVKTVDELLKEKCQKFDENSGTWVTDVKSREAKEKVRNCTQLDKNLVNDIVLKVAQMILESPRADSSWNEGNFISIREIIKSIPPEWLAKLKNECGGLQTLLRNQHFLFLIVKGEVKFRKPVEKNPRPTTWKQKQCWFFKNHPQSCPLDDDKCSFIHEK